MWLQSYLTNRLQTVVIRGFQSLPAAVQSGVPQGTVLGHILFIIYVNDMESCIKHSVNSSFADDTRIMKAIKTESDIPLLQDDLNETINWSKTTTCNCTVKSLNFCVTLQVVQSYSQNCPFRHDTLNM